MQSLAVPPPLLRRALIGAASAAGPEFSVMKGAQNKSARLLELLGSVGAVDQKGTPQGPIRQTFASLIGAPETVDIPFQRRRKLLIKSGETRSSVGQKRSDAMRIMRGRQ